MVCNYASISEQIKAPEIVPPLRATMNFVNGNPRQQAHRVGLLKFVHELFASSQSLRGNVQ